MKSLQAIVAIILCLMALGCDKKQSDRPAVHPISGKLFVAGQPAARAQVVLYASADPGRTSARPHATVEADGSFHLTTFTTHDGAPVGDYAVTVVWPGLPAKNQAEDEAGPDRLGQRFADPKKPAAIAHIGPETKELPKIDLKPAGGYPQNPAGGGGPSIEQ